jgi:Electron transfer DM13
MKNRKNIMVILVLVTLVCLSCNRAENTSIVPLQEMANPMSLVKKIGVFIDGDGEKATGKASIVMNEKTYQLVFEDFNVNNGPNLHVYLSQELKPKSFIDLGDLKSIKGNQVYEVPSGINATSYKYALVYCQKYSHLFGSAELK